MENWISVKERLPKNEDKVFFLEVINGEEEYAGFIPGIGYFLEGVFYDWFDHEHNYEDSKTAETRITHWLPQPEYPDIKTSLKE